jgi:hypothetical protein
MGLLTVACSEHTIPVAPPAELAPESPVSLSRSAVLTCRADVAALSVSCADESPRLSGGAHGDIIVGGQNLYVKLTSSNISYNSTTGGPFTFDVTVQNLLPQAMGTTNGTTADTGGVKVFFQTLPTPVGTGPITITNADGINGTFTATNQTYYKYSGSQLGADNILSPNETSQSKSWAFNVPNTVTTFTFAVYVNAALPAEQGYITVSPSSASVIEAGTQALTATVKTAVGNTLAGQTVTWGTGNSAVATVASDGTITAVAPGSTTITATSGARTGTTTVTVCPNLALGGVSVITGPTAASFCLAGGTGNEYVVVPYNGDAGSTLGVSVTATGISAVSGTPTPYVAPTAPVGLDIFAPKRDLSFESRLRARERSLAGSMRNVTRSETAVRAMRSLSPRTGPIRAIVSGPPTVGDVWSLNVETSSLDGCSAPDNRAATVKAVTTHAIILNENDNPAGFVQADFDEIAATFDTLVYPLITTTFGASADIDNNGRIVILYSRAVNELTPGLSSSYVGGFVYARDLYPTAACANSNVGEMFYMLAPDPTGVVNGNVRLVSDVKKMTIGTLAHEFQHLINASRRLYITPGADTYGEEGWLNEGLAHIAEELLYYHVSGKSPRSDLTLANIAATQTLVDAFNNYEGANYGRFKQHLIDPETDSPLQSDDDLGTRGSAWAFLRYAADRRGGTEATFWTALVKDATLTGTANLTAALGTSVTPWLRDFAAAVYADNISGGVPAAYSSASWNFRSVYSGIGGFSLAVVNPSSGVAYSPTLALGGGASYLRMGVAASTYAPVSITKAGGGALPSTFSAMVIRRK